MSTLLDLADNSSDSEEDLDYVPPGNLSEMSEDDEAIFSDEDIKPEGKKTGKKARKVRKIEKKVSEETKVQETPVIDEKQKANDIWKSFLSEVAEVKTETCSEVSFPVSSGSSKEEESSSTSVTPPTLSSPKKASEILLEFAGEVVSVTSDGCLKSPSDTSCDSQPAKNAKEVKEERESSKKEVVPSVIPSVKRRGLDSVLNTIMNKKQKITTLQKSQIDWTSFKKNEGIEEELEKFNKGKGGFIERQRFLERSDLRSFEVEKAMRLSRAKKK